MPYKVTLIRNGKKTSALFNDHRYARIQAVKWWKSILPQAQHVVDAILRTETRTILLEWPEEVVVDALTDGPVYTSDDNNYVKPEDATPDQKVVKSLYVDSKMLGHFDVYPAAKITFRRFQVEVEDFDRFMKLRGALASSVPLDFFLSEFLVQTLAGIEDDKVIFASKRKFLGRKK